jgi:uncharacterized protein (DUF983 family)
MLNCPNCGEEMPVDRALASFRRKPILCKHCGSKAWFKTPNGLAFFIVALVVALPTAQSAFGLSNLAFWSFFVFGLILIMLAERALAIRYGRMVRVPELKL